MSDSFTAQLRGINASSFAGNETARSQAYAEAQALVQRLEKPWERVARMVWSEAYIMAAIKTASDLDLFSHLGSQPKTSAQLAEDTGAQAAFLSRLLRILTVNAVVHETDIDEYVGNETSSVFADRNGVIAGIHYFHNCGFQIAIRLPEYLKYAHYRSPSDPANPPFKWIMDTPLWYWDWAAEHPPAQANLNSFLSSLHSDSRSWAYDYAELLKGPYDPRLPFIIDVGGGNGGDLINAAEVVSSSHPDAKLILQDRAEVISGIHSSARHPPLPPQIELMTHDFFTPQPAQCHHAKFYFMHYILHDWSDVSCLQILSHLKAAMSPDYSKILLLEAVMPKRASEVSPVVAAIDLQMMAIFSALERTAKQWRALIEEAGLKLTRFIPTSLVGQQLIEVEL